MPGAARFLYGLALGLSLGIIGVRLVAAAASSQEEGQSPARRPAKVAAKR